MFYKKPLKTRDFLILSFIVLVVILVYINTLDNPFVWDDEVIIESNQFIQNQVSVKDLFSRGIWGAKLKANSFYRPINALSFALDYKVWGLNPLGFHISSIFLFLIALVVLFFLLLNLGIEKRIVYFLVLGFGIHPLNTEAITYISGRADIFLLLFSLASFLLFLKSLKTKIQTKKIIYYIGSILMFVLALLSKESAVILPLIVGIFLIIFKRKQIKFYILQLSPLLFLSFLYTIFRFLIIGSSKIGSLSTIAKASLWERIITLPRILLTYIVKIVFPFNLHMEYLFVERSILSPYFILGLPILGLIIYGILKVLKFSKYALFFMGWFFIGLLPFLNIFPTLTATLREHWVIFSMVGFLSLLALLFQKLFLRLKDKKIKIGLMFLIIALFLYWSGLTVIRNNQWQNPIFLYKHDLKYEPDSFLLHNNLGVAYFRNKIFSKAQNEFLAALNKAPGQGYAPAYNNLAVIYQNQDQKEKAIEYYKKSIMLNNYILAYQNLVELYIKESSFQKASNFLNQGLTYHPQDQKLLNFQKVLNNR